MDHPTKAKVRRKMQRHDVWRIYGGSALALFTMFASVVFIFLAFYDAPSRNWIYIGGISFVVLAFFWILSLLGACPDCKGRLSQNDEILGDPLDAHSKYHVRYECKRCGIIWETGIINQPSDTPTNNP